MEGSGDTKTKLEKVNEEENQPSVETIEKATTRKEDVPIDVNKRQAEENGDLTKKLVGLWVTFPPQK